MEPFDETEAGYRVRLWFVSLGHSLPIDHLFNKNEKRYVPAVPPSQVEARHLIPPHVDISALAPFEGTLPSFRVHYKPSSAARGKAEEAVELPEDSKSYDSAYFIFLLTTSVASFFRRKRADNSFCFDHATDWSAPQEAAKTCS